MLRTVFALAAWACLGFVAYATISPIGYRPEIDTGGLLDRLAYFDRYIAFMVLGSLFYLAYPQRLILVCVIVLGSAVIFEFAQLLVSDRHARVSDALQKILGGVFGIVFSRGIDLLRHRLGWID